MFKFRPHLVRLHIFSKYFVIYVEKPYGVF